MSSLNIQQTKKLFLLTFIFSIFLVNNCKSQISINLSPSATSGSYFIGGAITGLSYGETIVLQNNDTDNLTITGSGTDPDLFTFATSITSKMTYSVTVLNQPITKICVAGAGFGTVINYNVTDILITCGSSGLYTVGGTVTGLSGTGLQLTNNGTDIHTIPANGYYTFAVALSNNNPYNVTVSSQPVSPNQSCLVSNGSGNITSANVIDVNVTCTTNSYLVSGSVIGLSAAETITLQNNSADSTTITGAGGNNDPFTFSILVNDSSAYSVTIQTPPAGKICTVNNGSGTMSGAVSTVSVGCIPAGTYSVGGTLSGLAANTTLVIQLATGEHLTLSANGGFTFTTPQTSGYSYTVSVFQQPNSPSQTCTVSNGTASGLTSNVTNVGVSCVTNTFTANANVTGLTALGGNITIKNNGANAMAISSDGVYTFPAQNDGTAYNITISAQSAGVNCSVAGGNGVMSGSNIMASITCNPVSNLIVSTSITGITVTGGGGLLLQLNGTETSTAITTNTTYNFSTVFHSGDHFSLAVTQNPDRIHGNGLNQICTVINGSGTINSNVTIAVSCATATYSVGGTVNGLASGETVILANNGSMVVNPTGASPVTFTFPVQNDATTYSVSVLLPPTGKTCAAGANSGTIAGANINTVLITCSIAPPISIGGNVTGLFGSGMVLQNNGGDNLAINGNGSFTFSAPLYQPNSYSVTVYSQPTSPTQVCSVTNGGGNVSTTNITNIIVSCSMITYSLSGTVTGLANGDQLNLTNNFSDFVSITSAGTGTDNFVFNRALNNGDYYNVFKNFSIPGNIQCNSFSGFVTGANVTVALTCIKTYAVGGVINGLPLGYSISLKDTFVDPMIGSGFNTSSTFSGTGSPINFAFLPQNLSTGATFNVTTLSLSPGIICSITNGSGSIASADITNVTLNCSTACGNGVIDPGETCDDSNMVSGDGCSSTCQSEGIAVAPGATTNFDDGTMQGWSANGLWHLDTLRAASPLYSMHYALASTGTYDTGSANSGALTSPPMYIDLSTTTLSFDYFHKGECGNGNACSYDKLSVEVSTDAGLTWSPIEYLPDAELGMTNHHTSLIFYSGMTVNIRFYFNTVDGAVNDFEGSYIDNISLVF